MFDPDVLTLREMADLVRRGALSSESLVQHYLRRIEQHNPRINALIQLEQQEVLLEQARNADARAARGLVKGPLHGVPITVKDVCHVNGFAMSRGMAELRGAPSVRDATVVARLREAGALILGISNVPELCMAFETENLLYGRTYNPHDLRRSAGGSSGGEAAAIAAGCSPGGLGSDACGSVRIPAHFNGICGFKLTQGRVPLTGQFPNDRSGLFHLTSSFGVMGRYVDDVDLLGRLISGADGKDPDTVDADYPPSMPLADMRVAFSWESARAPLSPAVRRAMERVQGVLGGVVAEASAAVPESLDEASDVLWRVFITGADRGRGWKTMFNAMGKTQYTPALEKLLQFSEASELSVDELKRDLIMIDTFRYRLAQFFNRYDVLVTPVYPDVAYPHGQSMDDPGRFAFVFPFSLSGSPAVVVPVASDPATGMPIAIQLVAPHWHEERLLTLGRFIERQLGGWRSAVPASDSQPAKPMLRELVG